MSDKSVPRILIMGAAGRDFHNFNVVYRDNAAFQVVAFTATQIPNIEGRLYPPELAGSLYPKGIPIHPEEDLEKLIDELNVDQVVFSYSDISHETVMHAASRVASAGADFVLLGPKQTMIPANIPVVSVCAVRTGCGKSQTSRKITQLLIERGIRPAVIRHPMPYGDLVAQKVQRFASYDDLDRHNCTIEEREEYEPYIEQGLVIYAGVDYAAILAEAQKEANLLLWDGGNNDYSFYRSDLEIVVTDPHRADHGLHFHPGETNLLRADVVVINKVDTASPEALQTLESIIQKVNKEAQVIKANSAVTVEDKGQVEGKKVLAVDDGPTLTHGGMPFGAGKVAADLFGAASLADPRPHLQGSLQKVYDAYPHLAESLPAMGYFPEQLKDLKETIERTPCDLILVATPIDLRRLIHFDKPAIRVGYHLDEIGSPHLGEVLDQFLKKHTVSS